MDIEERQKFIEGILSQIRSLNAEISELSRLRMQLGNCAVVLDRNTQCWNQAYHAYLNMELAPEIRIMNQFEGVAADGLSADIPPVITYVEDNSGKLPMVSGGIADQKNRLEERMTKLRSEINTLQASLSHI